MKGKILIFLLVLSFMLAGATSSSFATTFKLPTWYDNNKLPDNTPFTGDHHTDGDRLMCWAASAANALSWTGWIGDDPTITSSEDIWDHFKYHFSNEGLYSALWGVKWFFDGASGWPGWGAATTDGGGGGFYPAITTAWPTGDFWSMAGYLDNGPPGGTIDTDLEILQGMDAWLHDSAGVMLNIAWGAEFGHAVTVWGYDLDDDSGKYTHLWITDPDSNLPGYGEFDGLIQVAVDQDSGFLTDYLDGGWEIIGAQWLAHSTGGGENGVPEPATLLLLGSGLVCLFGIGRKKFKRG